MALDTQHPDRIKLFRHAIRTLEVLFAPLSQTLEMEPMTTRCLDLIRTAQTYRTLNLLIIDDVLFTVFQYKVNVIAIHFVVGLPDSFPAWPIDY